MEIFSIFFKFSLGYAFQIAADLETIASNTSKWIQKVTTARLDDDQFKSDDTFSSISMSVDGILKFSKAIEATFPLNEEQLKKFVNYFLSFRLVEKPKSASLLLEVLGSIAADRETAPICISFIGDDVLKPDFQVFYIKVLDILGKPLKPAISSVVASVLSNSSKMINGTKIAVNAKSSDKTVFDLDLESLKFTEGIYKIDIRADNYQQILTFRVNGGAKSPNETRSCATSIAQMTLIWISISFLFVKLFSLGQV